MNEKVLIVEDDADISELLSLYLTGDGYDVVIRNDGASGLEAARSEDISLALVDIMMPKMNGYEFIREIRKERKLPIIIVSAKNMDEDEVLGLNLGADAYIKKPFNPLVVLANIKAVMRRSGTVQNDSEQTAGDLLKVGELTFDSEKFLLYKKDRVLPLTMTELKIVAKLMKSPQRVFTKAQLYESINGDLYESDDNTMMVHISNIRAKIEENPEKPEYIKTVRGLGYKIDYKKN